MSYLKSIVRSWPRHARQHHGLARRLRVVRRGAVAIALLIVAATSAMPARAGAYEDFFDAITRDDARDARALMLKGVDPNSPDRKLGPALVYAAQSRAFAVLRVLLDSPVTQVDAVNAAGESALMYLALYGEVDLARRLIARGAQVNKPGWTPLHYAASGGSVPMVKFLLEQNAFIDALSPNQTTPLMLASRQKQVSVAKVLVEEGADPSLRNESGRSAADYFIMNDDPITADWMRARADEFLKRYGTREQPVPASSR